MVGIYQIVNKVNGKRYVGQSITINQRKYEHFCGLKHGVHYNKHLQHAANKYGVDNFEFVVLLCCDKENLTLYEQMCVDGLDPEYNICKECVDSPKGLKRSKETRKKIRDATKGRRHFPMSEETKKKLSIARKGKKPYEMTDEMKKKMSRTHTGMTHTEEAKKKMSIAKKKVWENEPKKYKIQPENPISDETRRKMSEAKIGTVLSEETKRKMSESAKKRWQRLKTKATVT